MLTDEPGLTAASVTIETAPDSGYRLRNEVEMNIDPNALDTGKYGEVYEAEARPGPAFPCTRTVASLFMPAQ